MNPFLAAARFACPRPIKVYLRSIRRGEEPLTKSVARDFRFHREIKRFIQSPESYAHPQGSLFKDLIDGWGNSDFVATEEYLAACVTHALNSSGPTLECGSGLSTVLMSAVAKKRGHAHWVLEDSPDWATKVFSLIRKYSLDSAVSFCVKPLRDYGDFCWYDPPLESMPGDFDLVICDGPPGTTKGGRYGLVPIMKEHLKSGCVILLDDAGREGERAAAARWETELNASSELCGSIKPYIRMSAMSTGRQDPA